MFKFVIAAAAGLLLAACATNPAKIEITPQSSNGLIVMAAEPVPGDYALNIYGYDPASRALTSNWITMDTRPSVSRSYIVREAKPGRYVLKDVSQQSAWAVCFHDNSVSFDVKPGEVLYLGLFDPAPHLLQLQMLALSSGRTYARSGTVHHFFDDINAPKLSPASEADIESVQNHLAATSPLVSAPVHVATFEPAKFGTGRDLFGLQRICGGWYAGSAKE